MERNLIFILRIVVAALCGMFVGLERSKRQKDAGIRTHMVVSMGAALMMIVSKYGFMDLAIESMGMKITDGSRIAAQIVSGIGFLGAGVIFVNHKQTIKGLTTAAGIWTVAGVGMAIGAGMYVLGVASSVIIVILQFLMHLCFTSLDNTVNDEVNVVFDNDREYINRFIQRMQERGIEFSDIRITRDEDKKVTLQFSVRVQHDTYEKLLDMVWDDEKINSFSV